MEYSQDFFAGLTELDIQKTDPEKNLSDFENLFKYERFFSEAMLRFDLYQEVSGNAVAAFVAVDIYHLKSDALGFLLFLVTMDKISISDYRKVEEMLSK